MLEGWMFTNPWRVEPALYTFVSPQMEKQIRFSSFMYCGTHTKGGGSLTRENKTPSKEGETFCPGCPCGVVLHNPPIEYIYFFNLRTNAAKCKNRFGFDINLNKTTFW